MTYSYLQGFADAMKKIYANPYSDKTQAALFMQYHNGHNSGCWHKRGLIEAIL
jgi:hypothetical protein